MVHPLFKPGNTALITGGASGIGLALAKLCHTRGLNLLLVDTNSSLLSTISQTLPKSSHTTTIATITGDVSQASTWSEVSKKLKEDFNGKLHLLALNAGRGPPRSAEDWKTPEGVDGVKQVFETNVFGVLNGIAAGTPFLDKSGSAIVITGSKQGITNPPGGGGAAGYNASKAAVKSFAENLHFQMKDEENVSVHLLVPGWVFTGLTGAGDGKEKPKGAWEPEQCVEYLDRELEKGKDGFWIICPDNECDEETDRKRMLWSGQEIGMRRKPQSRWREEYKKEFEEFKI